MAARGNTAVDSITAPQELLDIASEIVARARPDEQVEVACSHRQTTSVKTYDGALESLTVADSFGVGIRVLIDGREGFASAGSLDPTVIDSMLANARDNATFAEADDYAGIAEDDGVQAVEIDLWRDELGEVTNEEKINTALRLEQMVRDADTRITGVRNAGYGDSFGAFALASSSGIRAATRATSSSVSVSALAPDGDKTQTGYAYDGARQPGDLDLQKVADRAVRHTVDMIGATKPKSGKIRLLLDQHVAATILGLIASTLSGDRVIKGRSPYVDRVDETIGAEILTFADDPTDPASLGADSHDGEGLACRRNALVTNGVLRGFIHDSYTGRRSGEGSTASAIRGARGLPGPGIQALCVAPGSGSFESFVDDTEVGLVVYNLAGLHSGVNPVSGDFSVGVQGRMVRDGQLAEPVSECTIASTLQRLLLDVEAIGDDLVHLPNGVSTPSVVIGGMSLSGAA